ncbi:hypothetical protein BKG76_16385 [Mycobacteroides franklinii]|uniref:Uncharacterized protein n=1 Tax=Mycobacteroides franklinii TaxID=948102 RepID=A0A1S1L6T8_9MYCO|nr:hypothetical protein [Mycobacteroides franklinii]OHU22859.1 hypothetical protein BKG76_16385 [Mycobacteroides franklinii]
MAETAARSRAAATGAGVMKLHRHSVVLDARPYTVITLRADAGVRFSTNRFHETWHVISDEAGAKTLARLLWGLAYQRHPGTLVLIDSRHLDPNPFDAEPADPVVLLPSHSTVLTKQAARALRRQPWTKPDGTVRWRTHGLDTRTAEFRRWQETPYGQREYPFIPEPTGWETVERIGGLLVLAGSPQTLRQWAVYAQLMRITAPWDTDYEYLADREGEIQIFRNYHREVGIARQARADILGAPHSTDSQLLREAIWARAAQIRGQYIETAVEGSLVGPESRTRGGTFGR